MNRKTKIILSVIGIFSVLLTLLTITYAYFLTRIIGNPTENTFDVETSKVEVTYSDNNEFIELDGVRPSVDYVLEKDFVATNTGEEKATYGVTIEDITNTFELKKDLVYILECTSNQGTCNGVSTDTKIPSINSLIVENDIEVGEVHNYKLKVKYKETGEDQSIDMNKNMLAKINLADPNSFNPFEDNKSSLAYKIIDRTQNSLDSESTIFVEEEIKKGKLSLDYERELRLIDDDYGKTYYFRGNVLDNYVNFANKCWRIVRIEGDGSIKLILEDKNHTCDDANYSNNSSLGIGVYGVSLVTIDGAPYRVADYLNSTRPNSMRIMLHNWFNDSSNLFVDSNKALTNVGSLVKEDKWCFARPNTSTLECSNLEERDNAYIGTLSSDEVLYAGGSTNTDNTSFYLYNGTYMMLLINPAHENRVGYGDQVYTLSKTGRVLYNGSDPTYDNSQIRPAITLVSGVEATGMGTKDNPYVVVVK